MAPSSHHGSHPSCESIRVCLKVVAMFLLISAIASAQQPNSPNAGLSVNGTGLLNSAGAPMPTSSMISPSPVGSAPLHHHRAGARIPLEVRLDGLTLQPLVLVWAPNLATPPVATTVGIYELDLATTEFIANGWTSSTLPSMGAVTSGTGRWSLTLPAGLPDTTPTIHLQGALADPSAPGGLLLTAAVTVDVRNDPETAVLNMGDALDLVWDNPLYLSGTLSSGFLIDGYDPLMLLSNLLVAYTGNAEQFDISNVGPDTLASPPLPTGPPTPGQSTDVRFTWTTTQFSACGNPSARGEVEEHHGWKVIEEGGAWKVHGTQMDVEIDVELDMTAGPIPGQLDVWLNLFVGDANGLRGGITGVAVFGPQLQSLNASSQAQTAANGSLSMNLSAGGPGGPSEWNLDIQLAAAGTSRMPIAEGSGVPPDTYSFTVTWADNSTSGPYAVTLRASVLPNTNPAGALAALPGPYLGTGPLFSLQNAGTSAAQLTISSVDLGTLPASAISALSLSMNQAPPLPPLLPTGPWSVEDIRPASTSAPHTITICVPGMLTGYPVGVVMDLADIHGCNYKASFSFTP